mgnify:CR=1 FL=1
MQAVIELGGKQYLVKEKDILRVEKLEVKEGEKHTVDKVLLVTDESKTNVGAPYVFGAGVELILKKTGLGDKVISFKMKAKKRYKRLKNHRQPYSEVEVVKILAK